MCTSNPAPTWLKVCVTCDRYAAVSGKLGALLANALERATQDMTATGLLAFRRVPCLSGCKNPGNIALGATAKTKIRLNRLSPDDAADLATLVALYVASATGEVPEADWPEPLRGHLATTIASRRPADTTHKPPKSGLSNWRNDNDHDTDQECAGAR